MKIHTQILEKKEVTEEQYENMLGALPPERMTSNGFLVGEPMDHVGGKARFEMYVIENSKYYYSGLATIKDFEMMLIPEDAKI